MHCDQQQALQDTTCQENNGQDTCKHPSTDLACVQDKLQWVACKTIFACLQYVLAVDEDIAFQKAFKEYLMH